MSALANPADAAAALDYEALYARYMASLVDDLRGFRAAAPGLELWVPDEDVLASLRNLLDASATVGRERLLVRLSAKVLSRLGADRQGLLSMARAFGDAQLVAEGDALLLDVQGLGSPTSGDGSASAGSSDSSVRRSAEAQARRAPEQSAALDPATREVAALRAYRPALERAARSPTHRSAALAEPAGSQRVSGALEGAELRLVVAEQTICCASFEASDPLQIGLLESLCRCIEGLPLLEAAEHGTIRLERVLRGAEPRPVAGIVLPESMHPLLRLARALLAQTLAEYRRQTGFTDVYSRHDDRPGEAWLRASDAERRQRVLDTLTSALAARGLGSSRVSVEAIRYDVRVELALELPPEADAPVVVMALERALAAEIDPRLEVYVTERRDRNAKRRLAVLGDEA